MNEISSKNSVLSDHLQDEIEDWISRYPIDQKQSAVLGALRALQHEEGYLPVEKMDAIAEYLEMPTIALYEVASFYSMFELKPVGKHTISVCTNLSCMLRGADEIVEHLKNSKSLPTQFKIPCHHSCN